MKLDIKKHWEMWNHHIQYLIAIVLILPLFGQAQVQDLNNAEEVMVIAPFNPSISKATKMNFSPTTDTNQTHKLNIDYLTSPKLFATNFSLEKLTAAKFVDRRSPKYPQNFVKAGFGMYTTPYAELLINNKMSNASIVGVHLRHISTEGGIDQTAFSGHSLSSAEVWTKHIRRKQTTKVGVDYKRNQIHYYGFNPEDYPVELANTNNDFKEEINQVYSHVGLDVDIQGNFDTKKRDWGMKMNYQFFWDNYNSQEHLADIKGHYDYAVDWIAAENQYIGAELSTNTYYTTQNYSGLFPSIDSSIGYFHGLYELTPYYHVGLESISLQIGAKLSMGLDTNTHVSIAPMVKLNVGLLGDQLSLYALADGGYTNNSLYSLSKENSFISPVVPLKYSRTKYHIQAGLKGHYLSFLDYHIYAETALFEDMPMFITDTLAQFHNSFTTIYDGGQKLGAGMELLFKTERWNIGLDAQYNSFTMDTASRAWQKPELRYKLKVAYYILENLKVTGLLLGQSSMYNLYRGEQTVEPWMDFSLMADYHLQKDLGFFVNISNIFSDQYQLWYGYPVQSFGIMGGVHFSF
ncbi:MAG: TonB-dependent receptor [Methylococcales bacterium]